MSSYEVKLGQWGRLDECEKRQKNNEQVFLAKQI